MFQLAGGLAVERVRKNGDLFIAGIEVTYAADDDGIIQWGQLVYSRGLNRTLDMFRKNTAKMARRPDWLTQALSEKSRGIFAENMALSALCTVRGL